MARIAIVDDNETWCFTAKLVLEGQGHDVELFTNPHVFLASSEQFDLAIIDFILPARNYQSDLDGLALVRQLKQQDRSPLLILVSAFFTDDLLAADSELRQAADAVLPKPMSLEPLLDQIQQRLSASHRAAPNPNPTEGRSDR